MRYNPVRKTPHNHGPRSPKYMEVWFAELPFDDVHGSKKRPCVVVGRDGGQYHTVMITSSDTFSEKDFRIMDTEYAGLEHNSTVRPERIYSLVSSKFDHKLGELSDYDREELNDRIYPVYRIPFD